MERKLILVAGHDLNGDPGAVPANTGAIEAQLTVEFRDLLETALKSKLPTIEIVCDSNNINLRETIAWVNRIARPFDLLLDIHFNAVDNPVATGTECFVHDTTTEINRRLALSLTKLMAQVLGIRNRGVKGEKESPRKRLGILHTKPRVILLEICFISNPNDLAAYNNKKHELADRMANLLIGEVKWS
jgi:N-acetylmuramoyl-L-alanine amidase